VSRTANTYVYSIIALGLCAIGYSAASWQSRNPAMFVTYLAVTILASGLKVTLPGVTGTMSVWFLFMLIGFTELSLAETVTLGCGAALVQSFWHAKRRPRPEQILFNVAAVALAAFAGYSAYHWGIWPRLGVHFPMPIGIAALVLFVGNTGPVALVIGLTENKSAKKIWKECYFWCLPYYLLGASFASLFSFLTHRFGWEVVLMTIPLVVFMFRSYTTYLGKLHTEKVHAEKTAALHLRTIEALALAIEAKDETTHAHLERVKVYALEIGRELDLDESQLNALEAAALLHDIGKLAVPEHIISKPGKLTTEEFEKMKIHPVVGAEILERVQFPYPVAPIVRAHHEKWDGSGYPLGLKGEEIPIGARILSAVDCLDALASDRQYRPALPLPEAMAIVSGLSGTAYDPRIIGILERRYVELENKARTGAGKEALRLSINMKIDKGTAPAAGFEAGSGPAALLKPPAADFLASIAAARQEAQEFYELAKDLGNSLSLDETLWMISARVRKMVPYDAMCIFICKDQKAKATFATGESSLSLFELNVPFGEGVAGWVAASRQPILNGSPSVETGFRKQDDAKRLASVLAVPLDGLDGVAGVVALYRCDADAFSRDQLRILQAISQKMAAAIENALKYEQVKSDATIDHLTSLPNARSLFVHLDGEVNRSKRNGTPLAVLVCDLDGFKNVNDRFGHLVGNELLREVAIRLRKACRDCDYVGRMGGDEFVLVLPGMDADALQLRMRELERLATAAAKGICGDGQVTLSVGCSLLGGQTRDAEDLLAEADRQMYRAKQNRRSSPRALDLAAPEYAGSKPAERSRKSVLLG
jgi:diguanylate cyclase (GGDEF)-like protein/putative nucleotidyltransferase with HDIG domain